LIGEGILLLLARHALARGEPAEGEEAIRTRGAFGDETAFPDAAATLAGHQRGGPALEQGTELLAFGLAADERAFVNLVPVRHDFSLARNHQNVNFVPESFTPFRARD
jgi:hypothetical protein